jgi:hypothetical protein
MVKGFAKSSTHPTDPFLGIDRRGNLFSPCILLRRNTRVVSERCISSLRLLLYTGTIPYSDTGIGVPLHPHMGVA